MPTGALFVNEGSQSHAGRGVRRLLPAINGDYDMSKTNAALIKAVRDALAGDGKASDKFKAAAPTELKAFETWYKALRADAAKEDDGEKINNRLGVYALRYRADMKWVATNARAKGGGRKAKSKKSKDQKNGKPEDVTPTVEKYRLAAAALMAYRLKIPAGTERDAIDAGIIAAIKGK